MIGLFIALIFVSSAAVTAFIGMHLWNWRARAIDRIAPRTEIITPFLPSPNLVWRELVDRIGTHVPASSKDLPLLRRRLVRAGFRNPAAVRLFHGTRAVVTVILTLAGLVAGGPSAASG